MVMMMTTAIATPTAPATATATAMATTPPPRPAVPERRKFTDADLRRMVKAGILASDDPVALRDGKLFYQHNGAPRRFNVDEYYALAEAGILHPEERVELLAGEIFTMAGIGGRHAFCVRWLNRVLTLAVSDTTILDAQNPVLLDSGSAPQPDLMVLRWRDDRYPELPRPEDVLLVIEVSDTTAGFDRRHKVPLYAAAGIPEMWMFDINSQWVEVYDQPLAGGYARMRVVGIDGVLTPGLLPDVAIPVAEVMPD